MRKLRAWGFRIFGMFGRQRRERELAEELESHLQFHIDDNVRAGMTAEEARRQALIKLGGLEQAKELYRERRGLPWVESVVQDVRYGARTLAGRPAFTLAAVVVLALGIGPTAALFALVRAVLLNPLPFRQPSRLIRLYEDSGDNFAYNNVAGGVFAQWKNQNHGFSDMALLDYGEAYSLSGAGGQLPEKAAAAMCTWNLFPLLGVTPALGRGFSAADDRASAPATVILSWGLWQRRFGGSASILGQTIHLDERPYTVIGVMPQWLSFPERNTQLWTPIYHEQPTDEMQALDSHDFVAIGRLRPGVTEKEATAELSVIVRRLHDQHLDNPFISKAAKSRPLLDDMVGEVRTPLHVLLAATCCVLLIACLNVAGLLVARGAARRREVAIRSALGGSRGRLLAQHLTESLLLCGAGGALGLAMAYAVLRWFMRTRPDISRIETVHMNATVVTFVVGLVALCALFVGVTSAWSVGQEQILSALQEGARSHTAGHGRVGLRKALLAAECGLTVVLLIGAGLLLKSYLRLRSSDLGCITTNVLTMRFSLPEAKYGTGTQRLNFFSTLVEQVRALPGVKAAGLVRVVPGQGYGGDSGFTVAEHPPLALGKKQFAMVRWADPGYFAALGIPFLEGHTFDEDQREGHADEVLITRAFARQYFPGEDPIGKHLQVLGRRLFRITGVVGDTRFLISEPARPMMYVSIYRGIFENATLVVRSGRDVNQLALPIQRIVQGIDPDLAVADVMTMEELIGKSVLDANFDATVLLGFAVLSLILAGVGLFGVLSYVVAQRTSEIGIRLALGARRGQVLRLTLLDGLRPAALGLALGLAAGMGAG
ncbi:MAG TPA: ABC transporter permease, partial [Terriglobales bacterium]|nr:ABC transporter permease [Terriglobales bacterium]